MTHDVDLLVVGGGVNGAGIARDAVGRGLSVMLCEKDDLAAHTSSCSTKLIHGGLRYLEQYEFSLVAKALAEREVILRLAPHISWPMQFVLPHESHLRPVWMIRLGLLLYDKLGPSHRVLTDSHAVDLQQHVSGRALRPDFHQGFVYADGWVQDARLVVLNAMDAGLRGACIRVGSRCTHAQVVDGIWNARLEDAQGHEEEVRARCLVNACGPWAGSFMGNVLGRRNHPGLRLVKGSHIVLPRLFDHDYAYLFQQPDRRIVFAIPYEGQFTLVGTTDVDMDGPDAVVQVDDEETQYLCDAVNRYFRHRVSASDVVWSYSGVRPLLDEGGAARKVSRDYRLMLDRESGAPVLHVFGGKITTYRRLSEEAVDQITEALGLPLEPWTAHGEPLPGGDFADAERLLLSWSQRWPWLPPALAHRWLRHYGTRTDILIGEAASMDDLGQNFGADLYAAEIDYLRQHEWARSAEDILWRRSKIGLHLEARQRLDVKAYLEDCLKHGKQEPAGNRVDRA